MGRRPSIGFKEIREVLSREGCMHKNKLYREVSKYGISKPTFLKLLDKLRSEGRIVIRQKGRYHEVCLAEEKCVGDDIMEAVAFLYDVAVKLYGLIPDDLEEFKEAKKIMARTREYLHKKGLITHRKMATSLLKEAEKAFNKGNYLKFLRLIAEALEIGGRADLASIAREYMRNLEDIGEDNVNMNLYINFLQLLLQMAKKALSTQSKTKA